MDREFTISLTGVDSHKVVIPRGQGSFSIGTKGISKGKYDVWVEKDSVIDRDAFNCLYTGYGQGNKEKYPYGDWPRWFYYFGNDTGFIEWSYKRRIEEFQWVPHMDMTVDFTRADIYRLFIDTEDSKIRILSGEKTALLVLSGTLENFEIMECDKIPRLAFYPRCSEKGGSYQLPVYNALAQATCVDINT
ncbi:MAG: hypothetical protein K2G55_16615, partial [Lachnospiraceae bacterium]|nr:hypothetical protein [Lachnospiraceae bacterium]